MILILSKANALFDLTTGINPKEVFYYIKGDEDSKPTLNQDGGNSTSGDKGKRVEKGGIRKKPEEAKTI